MQFNPKTAAKRSRNAGIIFAVMAVLLFALAYDEHRIGERPNAAIAQGFVWASLSVLFLRACLRSRVEV